MHFPKRLTDEPKVFCGWCGNEVSLLRCSCKGSSKYLCNVCQVKIVQLRRAVGQWPTNEFKELPEEQQQQFFQSIASCNQKDIKKAVEDILSKIERKEEYYEDEGKFFAVFCLGPEGF